LKTWRARTSFWASRPCRPSSRGRGAGDWLARCYERKRMAARHSPELAHLVRVAARAMERDALAAIQVAGFGMVAPRHFTLFRVLDPGTAGTRISDLARDADVSRQAIQQVAAELEALGIVETLGDATDGRVRLVRYTEFGREGFERCMAEFARLEREYEERLGARRARELRRALRELASES
jgi:DNA-binding MarR family transcriptional regulator